MHRVPSLQKPTKGANWSPKLLCCLEHYRVSTSKYHTSCCTGWSFQIHIYVQPLKHSTTIHLGIGLIITIFHGRKVFGKIENFLLPTQGFLSSQILEDELFPQGCFQTFFSADPSPPLCWMLIISHFKIFWWKGYTGWEETVISSVWVHLSHSLSHRDKAFLQGGQMQVFIQRAKSQVQQCENLRMNSFQQH